MSEEVKYKGEGMQIDIRRLWNAVISRWWIVLLSAVLCAVLFFVGTFYLITPKYRSSAMFYVNNNLSLGDTALSISSSDITAAKSLVDSYIVILKTRASLNEVIDYSGVDRTYSELRSMISAASVSSTEIFEVAVTSSDPQEAEALANAIAYILPKRISNIVEGTSAKVVEHAIIAPTPTSPSYPKNTMYGFLLGLAAAVGFLVIRELFDVTIRTENDVEQCCDVPILAAVPDMTAPAKGGRYGKYYYYGSSNSKKKAPATPNATPILVGRNISFSASEAYKLLRTKLQFSFTSEVTCPVIGVSSALAGEGKSLSTVNLAFSLAQLNKRVLLIDCDMRRPSLAAKLQISKTPGLSNYLSGQSALQDVIQPCGNDVKEGFDVITSGRNPPNPIELLSSTAMETLVNELRGSYDYILFDLPPVGEVSDAMVAAKLADGILLVARQNYGNTVALSNAVQQFRFVETRLLGIVLNAMSESGNRYGYGYRYGKKYYKYRHYYGYGARSSSSSESKEKSGT